jgi:hypothetical protein
VLLLLLQYQGRVFLDEKIRCGKLSRPRILVLERSVRKRVDRRDLEVEVSTRLGVVVE